jgi:hypothetical protein
MAMSNAGGRRDTQSVTEEQPPVTPVPPERAARSNRIVLTVCAAFFALCAIGVGAYAVHSYQDYAVRTSPPGGRTTTVPVDSVAIGQFCASSGKSTNCSPEYTLTYSVDGAAHSTAVRKELHVGDKVHAFEGSDGKWYVTEDPGFGNWKYAWMIWAGAAVGSLALALLCLRGRAKAAAKLSP